MNQIQGHSGIPNPQGQFYGSRMQYPGYELGAQGGHFMGNTGMYEGGNLLGYGGLEAQHYNGFYGHNNGQVYEEYYGNESIHAQMPSHEIITDV